MDRIDRNILACLQQDAAVSVAQVADRVGLSTTPCWRRIQKLEKDGVTLPFSAPPIFPYMFPCTFPSSGVSFRLSFLSRLPNLP